MLISEYVDVKWNSKTKKYYQDKGYIYTKMGDTFQCKTLDLTNGSNVYVTVQCDYCSKQYDIQWYIRYNKVICGTIHKDACCDCAEEKSKDVLQLKYGTSILSHIDAVNNKRTETNVKIYGCSNPFGNTDIQQKIKSTNLEKYGCENPAQNPDIKNKIKITNNEKYGCDCVFQCEEVKQKIKESCNEKYGYDNFMSYAKANNMFTGENSPHWSGGDGEKHRWNFEYMDWRNDVLHRDNHHCQKCNATEYLEVHHIENWASNIDKRYIVDNGITLCQKCHKDFHKIYSKYNNNIEQIIEFCK